MKKIILRAWIVMLAAAWMTAAPCAETGEDAMVVFSMTEKEATCIEVKPGQTFALKFVTSPGTGYGWQLAAPLDEKKLALIETRVEEGQGELLGAPEHEIWICRALAAGESEISLHYVRPWEKDAVPVRKHVFKVHIRCAPPKNP